MWRLTKPHGALQHNAPPCPPPAKPDFSARACGGGVAVPASVAHDCSHEATAARAVRGTTPLHSGARDLGVELRRMRGRGGATDCRVRFW